MFATSAHDSKETTRRPRHQWTFEQRLCLDVLTTSQTTELSGEDRALIFNTIYKDQITAYGNPGGLKATVIAAQYNERKKLHSSAWGSCWERICAVPQRDVALRRELQEKIDDVLQNGIVNTFQAGVADLATPPVTPRRTDRVRRETENPYGLVTPGPKTPVRKENHPEYAQTLSAPRKYATPTSSARKRPAEFASFQYAEDNDDTDDGYLPVAKRVRRSSPVVVIPPSAMQIVTYQPPQTPSKTPKRRPGEPREGATMPFLQPSGRALMLKPKEHEQASRPLRDVTEEAAHPHPPAMLFRFWHNKSHGINSSDGFISGKFVPQRILVEPRGPPDCNAIDMNDFAHHLNNRTGTDQDGIPSPL